jgi:hypothetical protein
MVLVRFAYGFLDRLVHMCLHRLCPFTPPPLQGFHHYYDPVCPHGCIGTLILRVFRLIYSLDISPWVPTFRTDACVRFMPPLCRPPLRQ